MLAGGRYWQEGTAGRRSWQEGEGPGGRVLVLLSNLGNRKDQAGANRTRRGNLSRLNYYCGRVLN